MRVKAAKLLYNFGEAFRDSAADDSSFLFCCHVYSTENNLSKGRI